MLVACDHSMSESEIKSKREGQNADNVTQCKPRQDFTLITPHSHEGLFSVVCVFFLISTGEVNFHTAHSSHLQVEVSAAPPPDFAPQVRRLC